MTIFRAGTISDVAAMTKIMTQAFDARYGEGWSNAQLLGTMLLPGCWSELAIDDGEPVGFSLLRAAADEAELLLVGVLPTSRRRGIGSEFIRRAAQNARDRGATRMYLEVRSGNNSAVTLYTSTGFEPAGHRKSYYQGQNGDSFDAITMARTL